MRVSFSQTTYAKIINGMIKIMRQLKMFVMLKNPGRTSIAKTNKTAMHIHKNRLRLFIG